MSIAMMDAASKARREANAAATTAAAAGRSKAAGKKKAEENVESLQGSDWDDGTQTGWEIPLE
eukprot:356966-Pleurochrysis_carterae.AAC.1